MRPRWDEYFMVIAKIISTRSTCNSRPAGAVIVRDRQILATGYNGAVPGAPHCSDEKTQTGERYCFRRAVGAPENDKYNFCRASHAEANAIALAARQGIALEGATLYTTLAPCYSCLKLLANARVGRIYYEFDYESTDRHRDAFWRDRVREAGIDIFEQLQISPTTIVLIQAALEYPTSRRRLAEPAAHEVDIGNAGGRMAVAVPDSIKGSNVRKKAVDVVKAIEHEGQRIEGPYERFRRLNSAKHARGVKAAREIGLINAESGSSSAQATELARLVMSSPGIPVHVNSKRARMSAYVDDGRLLTALDLRGSGVSSVSEALADAAVILHADLYLNLLDHFDLGLDQGSTSVITDRARPQGRDDKRRLSPKRAKV